MAKEDPLLIITGPPRSCTTAMAVFCWFMGNSIWPRWTGSNNDKGFEDQLAIFWSHGIVSGSLSEKEYSHEIANYPYRILKIPHLVTLDDHSAIDEWFRFRPKLKILLMVRDDLLEAARSMANNNMGTLADTPEEAAEILTTRFQSFRERINCLGISNKELTHPAFINQPEETIELLRDFAGISLTPIQDRLNRFTAHGETPLEIWNSWFDSDRRTEHKS